MLEITATRFSASTAGELEIKNISKETIKPSSPTPNHLRNFKLSFVEQIAPVMYTPIVLFYSQNDDSDHPGEAAKMCQRLKTSSSKILTLFYLFAGRFKDHASIECNDDGANFLAAQVKCYLPDIFRQPDLIIYGSCYLLRLNPWKQ